MVVENPVRVSKLVLFRIGEDVVMIGSESARSIALLITVNRVVGFAVEPTDVEVLFVVTTNVDGGVIISIT